MRLAPLALMLFAIGSTNCSAAMVYETFGAGKSYDMFNGATVGGPTSLSPSELAEQFFLAPASPNFYLDTVEFAFVRDPGAAIAATVTVFNDTGFDSIDTTTGFVAQVGVTIPGSPTQSGTVVADFNSAGALFSDAGILTSGAAYWIAITTDGSSSFVWADTSDTSLLGYQGYRENSSQTWMSQFRQSGDFPLAAYSVSGSVVAVPEPSTLAMLGITCLAFGFGRRKESSKDLATAKT